MITSSLTAAPASGAVPQKLQPARAADGDFKAPGQGHTVKDADGDYKANGTATTAPLSPAATATSAVQSALANLTKGG